jgi:nitronate monooxygenase
MAKIETEFTRMIDVAYPIIGAPMFLLSYEELAIAVAQAGGLGTIPLPNFRNQKDLKTTLKKIRDATDKPIGVNIHLSGRFEWKEQLSLCLDAGVKFFITSLGDPRLILDDVHANGGKVFPDVISLEQGLKARDKGADGLIAVASGAGGHCGTIPTHILVPYLKTKTNLPIIAAGGISTGAQMVAAMAVGACAVVVGTRLIATTESRAQPAYKEAVLNAAPTDIVCTDRITDNPASWLVESIKDFNGQPRIGSKRWRDFWSAGQSVAQVEEIKSATEVIREMVADYIDVCQKLAEPIGEQ